MENGQKKEIKTWVKITNVLALILVLFGAINWGLWGFFQFDFVAWFCQGNTNWAARLIYAIIGLAGVWSLKLLCKCRLLCCHTCKCSDKGSSNPGSGCGCK